MLKTAHMSTLSDAVRKRPNATKGFVRPMHLVFQKDGEPVIWPVTTLDHLQDLCAKVDAGDFDGGGSYNSMTMQLFAHLAEHVGFLRPIDCEHHLSEGLGLLKNRGSLLQEFGEDAEALAEAKWLIKHSSTGSIRSTPDVSRSRAGSPALKEDGINLTPAGEALIQGATNLSQTDVVAGNMAVLVRESEPGLTGEENEQAALARTWELARKTLPHLTDVPVEEQTEDRLIAELSKAGMTATEITSETVVETTADYEIPAENDGNPNLIECKGCDMKLTAPEHQLLSTDEINTFIENHSDC